MSEPRLMLVDIVNADPVHAYPVELFPYVRGMAAALSVPARWVRLGIDSPASDLRPRLEDDAFARLMEALGDAESATHALINVALHPDTMRDIAAARPDLAIRFVDAKLVVTNPGALRSVTDWLGVEERYAGSPLDGQHFVDVVAPDYRAEDLNHTPAMRRGLVEIFAAPTCVYTRPLDDNPFFADVDLSGAALTAGCSFCSAGPVSTTVRTRPLALTLRHLEAILAARGDDDGGEYVLHSSAVFLKLEPFFEGVRAMGFPPSTFLFSARIDELLRTAPAMRRVLPGLDDAGHRLAIQRIGVENFSPAENERMNKGVTSEEIDEAFALLAELGRDHPESFAFEEYGGFGFITFTPWTTLDDLEINLSHARRLGVEEKSFFLRSRLQLQPGRPITILAEHDGLLASTDAPGDHAFFSGCIRFADRGELPWRFANPVVGAIYAVARRLAPNEDIPDDDALLAHVGRRLVDVPIDRLELFALFEALLEAGRADPSLAPEPLLDRAIVHVAEGGSKLTARSLVRFLRAAERRLPGLFEEFEPADVKVEIPWMHLTMVRRDVRVRVRLGRPGMAAQALHRTPHYELACRTDPGEAADDGARVAKRIAQALDRWLG